MEAEKMEVYCMNIQCGDPEVHAGALTHHESRRYRRMNYMGSKEMSPARVLARSFMKKPAPPQGMYHYYSCPVCGAERVFHESKGLITEVDKETAKLVA